MKKLSDLIQELYKEVTPKGKEILSGIIDKIISEKDIKAFINQDLLHQQAKEIEKKLMKWVDSKNWEAMFPDRLRGEVKKELKLLIKENI